MFEIIEIIRISGLKTISLLMIEKIAHVFIIKNF